MAERIDIAALRKRLGMTRKQLAEAVGASATSTICRWENRKSEPRGSALKLLKQLDEQSRNLEAA
jgi:DNA-binding transcriptional regulator YiaG